MVLTKRSRLPVCGKSRNWLLSQSVSATATTLVPPARFTSAPVTAGIGVGVAAGAADWAAPLLDACGVAEAGGSVGTAVGFWMSVPGAEPLGEALGELLAGAGSFPDALTTRLIGPRVSPSRNWI